MVHCPRPSTKRPGRVQWFRQSLLAAAVLCGLAAFGRANDTATGPTTDDTLSNSAQVPVRREIQLLLAEAEANIDAGRFDAALPVLDRVFALHEEGFVPAKEGHRYVSARGEANRLYLRIPLVQRQRWEEQYGTAARESLMAAVTRQDERGLTEIAVRFAPMRVGRDALRALSALYLDGGRFDEAAGISLRLVEHPLADSHDVAIGTARLVASWIRDGETARARKYLQDRREYIASATLQTVHGARPLSDWLQEHYPQLDQHKPPQTANHSETRVQETSPHSQLPSPVSEWEAAVLPAGDVAAFVNAAVQSWVARGVSVVWNQSPVLIGSTAVVRGIDELIALDVRSGVLLWKTSIGSLLSSIADNPKMLENELSARFTADAVSDRLLSDPVQGTLCTDGERVYGVVELKVPDATQFSAFRGRGRGLQELTSYSNRLAAWNARTGDEAWRLEEVSVNDSSAAGSNDDSGESLLFVHGPGLCRNGTLYATATIGAEMHLLAVGAADGKLQWTLPMADVPSAMMLSPRHRRLACPAAFSGGTLLCTTCAGVVMACDLSTRSWKWAFRYKRDDVPTLTQIGRGRRAPDQFVRWWDFWRSSTVAVADGRAIFATPDSDAIRALNIETGELLWERPRGAGLFVAHVSHDRLFVVEETAVSAVDCNTGETVWHANVGPAAAAGTTVGGKYFLPLRTGDLAVVTLADGSVFRSGMPVDAPLGTLIATDGGILSLTPERIVKLASLQEQQQKFADQLAKSPNSPSLMIRSALLDRQAGDFDEAQSKLRTLLQQPGKEDERQTARKALRETLLANLRARPDRLDSISREIAALVDNPSDRVEWQRATLRAQREIGRFANAAESCFDLLTIDPAGMASTIDEPGHVNAVRLDRFVWGELSDLTEAADSEQLLAMDAVFHKKLDQLAASPDPLVLERFVARVDGLRWEAAARERIGGRGAQGVGFLRDQLRLFEQIDGRDRSRNTAAVYSLGQLYEARGYRSDAATFYRRIKEESATESAADFAEIAARVAAIPQDSPLRREIDQGRNVPWSAAEPIREDGAARYLGIEFLPVPIEAERGSLFDRVSVYLQAQGKTLRFQGDEFREDWQLELPETKLPYRSLVQLARGWGLGHLLVVRLGTELFGVSVLDERGETNAKVLWRIDTSGDSALHRSTNPFQFEPAVFGFGTDELRLMDRFGWKCGRIGPVRPTYFCLLDGARLVCVDTLTGATLWERHGISHDAVCDGDERCVILGRTDSRRVEILRAADGKQIKDAELPATPEEFLQWKRTKGLLKRESAEATIIEQIDLFTGTDDWKSRFPSGSLPFELDSKMLGVITTAGWLHLISRDDGREVARHEIDRPEQLSSIHVSRDDRQFHVVLSAPIDPQMQRWISERGEFRNPVVNGAMHAIDRRTGRIVWQARLVNEAFQLDQPREAPFLVLNYRRATDLDERRQDGKFVTRLIDKRTGKDLMNDELKITSGDRQSRVRWMGCTTVETSPDEQAVDVVLPNKTVRFRYGR